ncbi:hypothetical protein [Lacticaseibacillus pantheris]|uniref:hypothetical protein n=1 Tax=Lacticaseibacillus pantheris TaxID=171523 RepID=UPI0006D161D9|nr:hypothetical protein [Lacticaseibacillus pantheris]
MVWTKWAVTVNGGDLDDFEEVVSALEDERPEFRRASREHSHAGKDDSNASHNMAKSHHLLRRPPKK